MRECSHEYDSYNGGLRCHLCDNRISESEYTEWLEAQVEALREVEKAARRVLNRSYKLSPLCNNWVQDLLEPLLQEQDDE